MARIEGKVTFIEGALPGELVELEYQKRRKDFDEARCVRVLEPHALRAVPPCPHYGICGGCNLQHAAISLQREMKQGVVHDLFRRLARIALPESWPMHGGSPWGYRHRARFVKGTQGWGFRRAQSHEILPIRSCPVLCDALNQAICQFPDLPSGSELQVFVDTQGQWKFWHTGMAGHIADTQFIALKEKVVQADAQVFFQSNMELAPMLLDAVLGELARIPNRRLAVDLFSGVGVFASFLQDHFDQVVAVEWNEGCLRHARNNLGKHCVFHSSSAEDYLHSQNPGSVDLLVVDPPRAGLSPEVRQALTISRPSCMVYVSCDPVTLARDVGEFVRNGFKLERIEAFDFYPQTDHLEMLAVLR